MDRTEIKYQKRKIRSLEHKTIEVRTIRFRSTEFENNICKDLFVQLKMKLASKSKEQ